MELINIKYLIFHHPITVGINYVIPAEALLCLMDCLITLINTDELCQDDMLLAAYFLFLIYSHDHHSLVIQMYVLPEMKNITISTKKHQYIIKNIQ